MVPHMKHFVLVHCVDLEMAGIVFKTLEGDPRFKIENYGPLEDKVPRRKNGTIVRHHLPNKEKSIIFLKRKMKEHSRPILLETAKKWFVDAGLASNGASARLNELAESKQASKNERGEWSLTEIGRR